MLMERVNENERVITSDDYHKVYVRRIEGVDLWEIHTEKGAVPKVLNGRYTSPVYAFDAVKNYLDSTRKVK